MVLGYFLYYSEFEKKSLTSPAPACRMTRGLKPEDPSTLEKLQEFGS
jgi:hypothetical protein